MTYTHSFDDLLFKSEDQNIFGEGAASRLEDSIFVGLNYNNTDSDTSNDFSANWSLDWFSDYWETGVEGAISLNQLKLGFEAGYVLDPGSIDSDVTYLASLTLPDNFVTETGIGVSLLPNTTLSEGSFTTQSPTITAYLDAIAVASGNASGQVGVLGSVASGSTPIEFNEQFNLIAVDPTQISLFSDIPGLAWSFDLLQASLDFSYAPIPPPPPVLWQVVATTPVGEYPIYSTFPEGADPPITVDLGSIGLSYPQVSVEGELESNTITGDGTDKILDFNIDLDGFFGLAANAYTPGSGSAISALTGQSFEIAKIFSGSYDLLDVEGGPTVNLLQDFTITPTLDVTLDFSKPVDITGVGTGLTQWSGQWEDLPEFSINETTEITPTFTVGATLASVTGLAFGLELTVEAFKAEIGFGEDGKAPLAIGPLWELDPPLGEPDYLTLPIFSNTFDLGGFGTIVGDRIVLTTPESGINGGIDDGKNDAPIAADDAVATNEDTLLNIANKTLLANDFDIDAYHVKSLTAVDGSATSGHVELLPSSDIAYDPRGGFDYLRLGETAVDTFIYTLSDELGATDTATVTVSITGINDPPEAENDTVTTDEETVLSLGKTALMANDFDVEGDTLIVQSIDGSSTRGTVGLSNGTVIYDPNHQFEFLAANERTTDTFLYTLSDGELTDTATVTVTIQGVNDIPVVLGETFAIDEDRILQGDVSLNDSDVDASDELRFSLISEPTQGVLTFHRDGSFSYDADADVFDLATPGDRFVESFVYEVNDGHGGIVQATATLNVDILDDGEIRMGTVRPDRISGTDGGEDVIYGNNGNDTLTGLDGADVLYGQNGSDVLIGGESADLLYGEQGNDLLTGGDGADQFWIEKSGGFDTITDFEIGIDVIGISGLNARSFAEIGMGQQGADAILDFGGAKVALEDVNSHLLSASDFLFA